MWIYIRARPVGSQYWLRGGLTDISKQKYLGLMVHIHLHTKTHQVLMHQGNSVETYILIYQHESGGACSMLTLGIALSMQQYVLSRAVAELDHVLQTSNQSV